MTRPDDLRVLRADATGALLGIAKFLRGKETDPIARDIAIKQVLASADEYLQAKLRLEQAEALLTV